MSKLRKQELNTVKSKISLNRQIIRHLTYFDFSCRYPGYKFSPKKKLSKPRAYKKRPENQFTARDHEDEQELYRLYHDGKDISLPSGDGDRFPLLLDAKEPKASNGTHNKKNNSFKHKEDYCLDYPESLPSLNEIQLNSSPYNTGLLYPPTTAGNLLYPQQLHSPSASPYTVVHSPSTSSYATGYYSSSEEPAQEISYNLYYTQCRYDGVAPHAYYPSPAQYFSAPRGYYYNTSSPLYDCPKSPQSIFVEETTTVTPSLLTSAFYYQQ